MNFNHILKADDHNLLTSYVIKLLNKKEILTVKDFMKSDIKKLAQISNLSIEELKAVKRHLNGLWGAIQKSGLELYEDFKCNSALQTGIESLDGLLRGGLYTGQITEICGLSASGKTQLSKTIAVNLAHQHNFMTIYFDTKRDFSGTRIHKMLESRSCSEDEICTIMKNIIIERVHSVHRLIELLRELDREIRSKESNKIKFIVIDSLSAIWFLIQGDKLSDSLSLLSEFANLTKRLSIDHNLIIVTVNIVTRWTTPDNIDEDEDNTTVKISMKPALGKYWLSIPSIRLLIYEPDDSDVDENTDKGKRVVKILKSCQHPSGNTCIVHINNKGVTS